jgi:hypothetical protein
VNESADQQALKLHHLPGQFLKSALISVPLYALGTAMVLAGLAIIISQIQTREGWWPSLAQWSLPAISIVLGLLGGGIIGALSSAKKVVRRLEGNLHSWLQQLPASSRDSVEPPLSLKEIRSHYDELLDQALTTTLGRIPLPGLLDRLIRSQMQQAIIGDFMASLEQRGLSTVGPQAFRNWLLTKGVSLGLEPAYDQLSFWQYVIVAALALFLVALVGLSTLAT